MPDDGAAVHRSWFRQYWFFALRLVVWLGLAAWLGSMLVQVEVALGIALILFLLEMGVGSALLGLVSKAYYQQEIDGKEATRRMWMVYSGQLALLVTVVILLLFSSEPVASLLPVIFIPVRLFLAFRLHRAYHQEPSGTYFRKGIFD